MPPVKAQLLSRDRLARLAERYGLHQVIRWKPKQLGRLKESGIDTVLTQTLYAAVGAVALSRGGDVAVRIVKGRVLGPLGLRTTG